MPFLEMQNNVLSYLPGLPRQLVKAELNTAYCELVRKWPWISLESTFFLQTTPSYSNGTISVSVGSTTVSGDNTSFSPSMVGCYIRINGEPQYYKFSVISQTQLELTTPYAGDNNLTNVKYEIFKTVYSLDPTLRDLYGMRYTSNFEEISQSELNEIDPRRNSTGTPTRYSIVGNDSNGNLQVEIWPRPTESINIVYYGLKNYTPLVEDSDYPLIDEDVIVKKARVNLAPAYMKLFPADRELIAAQLALWKSEANEAYEDLLSEDNRIRSNRDRVVDRMFASRQIEYYTYNDVL